MVEILDAKEMRHEFSLLREEMAAMRLQMERLQNGISAENELPNKLLYSISDCAEIFGLSPGGMRKLVYEGKIALDFVQIKPRHYVVQRDHLLEYMKEKFGGFGKLVPKAKAKSMVGSDRIKQIRFVRPEKTIKFSFCFEKDLKAAS